MKNPKSKDQLLLPSEDAIMRWAFEHSSNAELITGLDHRIRRANQAFFELFGFSYDETIGQHAGQLLHSQTLGSELREQIIQALELKGMWKGEVINYSKKGVEMPSLLSVNAIKADHGEKVGYLGIIIDLTERKKMEAQIAQGEKLSQIGESVATLMHEIRNPLTGISMNVFMLERKVVSCEFAESGHKESVRLISKEVKRLEALVKNALDYARNTECHPERVFLGSFLGELKNLVVHQSEKHGVAIHIAPVAENISAFFDPDLMKQVFINLVQNAIEAAVNSPERFVRIHVATAESSDWRSLSSSSKVLLLSVDNSGDRIPENVVRNLFKPFISTKREGIGLGLATASKIIRQHHGVLAHSHIHDAPFSTRFSVALPL